jgi:hypothetical protein
LGLYQIATLFADFFDRQAIDPIMKALHLGVIVGGAIVWSGGLAQRHALSAGLRLRAAAIAVFAMTSNSIHLTLHAEDVGLTLALYGWGAALRPRAPWQVAAGVVAGVLPFLKGLTLLYAAPVLGASLLACGLRSRGFAAACAAAFATVAALGGSLWFFASVQLTDLMDAATFQGSFVASTPERLERFAHSWGKYLTLNPIFLPGLIAASLHVHCLARARDWRSLAFSLVLWVIPLLSIYVQNRYFGYHFAAVALSAAYSLSACITWLREEAAQETTQVVTLVSVLVIAGVAAFELSMSDRLETRAWVLTILFAFAAAFTLCTSRRRQGRAPTAAVASLVFALGVLVWGGSPRAAATPGRVHAEWKKVQKAEKVFSRLTKRHKLRGKKLLLASFGDSARHLDVVSACRHFFPIPLHRFRETQRRAFEGSRGFREARNCFRRYRARFILVEDSWFALRKVTRWLGKDARYKIRERFRVGKRSYTLMERRRRRS